MTQAMDLQCYFRGPLHSIKTVPGVLDLEPARYSSYLSASESDQQNLMIRVEVELPELCDPEDLTITVLEGQGSLTLLEEVVTLEPGMLVYIPAYMPYGLRTSSELILMLNRCEPDSATSESVWVFNL